MTIRGTCAKCATALLDNTLEGLCPKCLAGLAFGGLEEPLEPVFLGARSGAHLFGDYELIGEIARGGMGVVYKARQVSLNRIVAVKMLLHGPFSSEEFVQRFQIEAEAAAGLQHPNIVAIHEVGKHDGYHYFSMEYIEGSNFSELVREQPLKARTAAGYLKTLAEALEYAHRKGVLHRDLKPSNVLLDIFGTPRITDFGLARLVKHDSRLTLTGQALGSPSYMSPEQALGKGRDVSLQSDVYSLGAILYHLITGRPPFQGETLAEVALQVQNNDPVAPRRLNPSVPAPLENICLKCLQKDPAKRYASAQALADDLGHFLANEPIEARAATLFEKLQLWCQRHPGPAILSLALFLVGLLGLAGVLWQWGRAEKYGRTVGLDLYAADVNLASQEMSRGNYGVARHTLALLQPDEHQEDLRGFEWRYLWNLCQGDQLATLRGHTWIVTCAAFSPDGQTLMTGSEDGTTKLWDVKGRRLITTFANSGAGVWSVGYSFDGTCLMSSGHDLRVEVRDVSTRHIQRTFPGRIAVFSKKEPVIAVAESSPFFWEVAGKIVLWNYLTGQKLREFDQPGRALALSPDDRLLAVAGPGSDATLWDVASGKLLRRLRIEHPIWSVAFSPDGKQLATAGWSKEALVWNLEGTDPPVKLAGHSGNVWSVTFSPDGSTIATTSSDQVIRFWDAATFQLKNVLHGHGNEVWCAAFSPDGKMLATGGKDETVRLWTAKPLRPLASRLPHNDLQRPYFTPDGSRLLLLNRGDPLRGGIWNVATRTLEAEMPDGYAIGFSPDGEKVIQWQEGQTVLGFWLLKDHSMTSIKLAGLAGFASTEIKWEQFGFSPDWKTLFTIDGAGKVWFWNPLSGKILGTLQGPEPPLRAVTLGPAGKYLAISLERETFARLYETSTGREVQLAGHRDFVSGLGFSPDGSRLATASMDGTIKLWDTATGNDLATLSGHFEEATDVAFSPDGRTLASLGRKDSIKFWHLATQRELLSVDFPEAGRFLQFSPDGAHLAVTADDDSVTLLDAPFPQKLPQAR